MKSKVFIASSKQAKARMDRLAEWLGDWGVQAITWDQVGLFAPGDFILERLLKLSSEVDGALILFGEEDKEWYHAQARPQPRDNVLIEYGIFASRLGRERVVVCQTGKPKVASDLGGLIFVQLPAALKKDDDAARRLRDWAEKLPDLTATARAAERGARDKANAPLRAGVSKAYRLPNGCEVRIQSGPLSELRNIDVIVSSENTDLQPARFYDASMSGALRYLDGDRNKIDGHVTRDALRESLSAAIDAAGVRLPVMQGAVIAMPTTGLKGQGVKYVFHAAVVAGVDIGKGYAGTQAAVEAAVCHSLERFEELAKADGLNSIMFPMFATGSGRLGEETVAEAIVRTIEAQAASTPSARTIYLYAFIEYHRAAFERAAALAEWSSDRL